MRPLLVIACAMLALYGGSPRAESRRSASVAWYRVTDGASIQAKIDSCIAGGGGVVYFPPGTYALPRSAPTLWLRAQDPRQAQASVTLLGDGPDVSQIVFADPASRDTMLHIARDQCRIEGLTFTGNVGHHDTTSVGLCIGDDTTTIQHVVKFVSFRDVHVRAMGRYAFLALPRHISLAVSLDACRFDSNGSTQDALVSIGAGNTTFHFRGCTFESFQNSAVRLDRTVGITFLDCIFESETNDHGPFFYASESVDCSITNGWFEEGMDGQLRGTSQHQWFVQLDRRCHGFTLQNCGFHRAGLAGRILRQPRAIQVLGATPADASLGVLILNPDMTVPGVVDSLGADYIDVAPDASEITLVGGAVRDSVANLGRSKRLVMHHAVQPLDGSRVR